MPPAAIIYEEKSELFDLGAERSLDKKVIFLSSYAKTSTEVRYLPADTPGAPAKVVLPREAEHEYQVDHYNGLFYITTNKGAKNFKVVTAPINDPSEKLVGLHRSQPGDQDQRCEFLCESHRGVGA